VVKDTETGFLVPVKRPDMLADKITVLLKDPSLALKMGNAGLRRAGSFDISHTVDEYISLFDELLDKKLRIRNEVRGNPDIE
jgi:glycosyltransferase involved in cell wall biosynthesis